MSSLEIFDNLLGSGSYGSVYLGEYKGSAVAIKLVDQESIDYIEIDASVRIYNDYIMRSQGFGPSTRGISFPNEGMKNQFSNKAYIVYPLALGDLKDEIDRKSSHKIWRFEEKISFMRKVAEALDCVHSNGIFHMDLKPENILFQRVSRTYEGQEYDLLEPLLSDFGLSRNVISIVTGLRTRKIIGTPIFNQPCSLSSHSTDYNYSNDVWAYALVFYEFLTGSTLLPYSEMVDTLRRLPVDFQAISSLVKKYQGRIDSIPRLLRNYAPFDRLEGISSFLAFLLRSSLCNITEAIVYLSENDIKAAEVVRSLENSERAPFFNEIVRMPLFAEISTSLSECAALIPPGIQYNSKVSQTVAHWVLLLLTFLFMYNLKEASLRLLFHAYDLALRYLNISPRDLEDPTYDKKSILLHMVQAIFLICVRYANYKYEDRQTVFQFADDGNLLYDPSLLDRYLSRIPRKLDLIFYRRHLYESLKNTDNLEDVILTQVWNLEQYFNLEQDWNAIVSEDNIENVKVEILNPFLLFSMLQQIEKVEEFENLFNFLRNRDWTPFVD